MPIELKKSPYLFGFAAVLVLATLALVWQHAITMREAVAFIMGALALPGLFGTKKKDDDDNNDGGVTVPVDDGPGASVQAIGPKKLPGVITPITMLFLVGCASATPQEKAAAADATYAANHLKCVDAATTLAESKACRARVRAEWNVDGGAK